MNRMSFLIVSTGIANVSEGDENEFDAIAQVRPLICTLKNGITHKFLRDVAIKIAKHMGVGTAAYAALLDWVTDAKPGDTLTLCDDRSKSARTLYGNTLIVVYVGSSLMRSSHLQKTTESRTVWSVVKPKESKKNKDKKEA